MNTKSERSFISLKTKFAQESGDWLVSALDPYHDYQYSVSGLPDERTAPSVVQIHNQSYSLAAPTSAGAGNWDASVLYTGINSPINCEVDNIYGGMITVTGSTLHLYSLAAMSAGASCGALNIWAGAAGSVMSTGAPVTVGDTYASLGSVLPTDRCRLIGVAFEVNNTTAAVYKQGSLTVAMLPDTACDTGIVTYYNQDVGGQPTDVQADRALVQACSLPPLLAVPGSSTWPAEEGVYCVPRMSVVPRDILSYKYTPGVADNQGASGRVPILYGSDGKIATPEPVGHHTDAARVRALFKPFGPSGFTPIQVWASGLSPNTTLTITFRTIVEYFPALGSPLLPLASPSPVFDPKVLAVYGLVAAEAPYAVPVDQNAAGDYFLKILKVLSESLQLVSPIFGQYAPIAAGAAQIGKSVVQAVQKKEAGRQSAQGNRKQKK